MSDENSIAAGSGVEFTRPELRHLMPLYEVVSDCLKGEHEVKRKQEKYLPKPNASDMSEENKKRYYAYLMRAVFFNVTARTHGGAVGFMFLRDPVIKLPAALETMENDATGEGVPLAQATKQAVAEMIAKGRAGLWADYPAAPDGVVTVEQKQAGGYQPTVRVYETENIINWRYTKVGGIWKLSLVVVREEIDLPLAVNRFEMIKIKQYRVLELDETNQYIVSVWQKPTTGVSSNAPTTSPRSIYTLVQGPIKPVDSTGQPFSEIPFEFLGVWKNVAKPDQPPLYDMAVLNIAHYRNSADYEESSFLVGQPTPWASGLTEDWVTKVLHNKIAIGARGLLPLPVHGQAGLLQAEPNTMPKEAMDSKEAQMRGLGAKLVATDPTSPDKTATEASINNVSETSVLSNVARNVSMGFTKALGWCAAFVGADNSQIEFEVHADLGLSQMTSLDRAELIAEWQGGAITWEEMRAGLKQCGVATEDDDKAKEAIASDKADELQAMTVNSIAPIIPGSTNDPAANQPPAPTNKPAK